MREDTPYWVVSPISYEDTVKLAASDLIENFQRDPRKRESRFWPGGKGTFKHLYENLPAGADIVNASGTLAVKKETAVIKAPRVIHRSSGIEIPND